MKNNQRPYQICTNCIMDTSDPKITFDARGWCDYCRNSHANILLDWHPDAEGEARIKPLIERIIHDEHSRGADICSARPSANLNILSPIERR